MFIFTVHTAYCAIETLAHGQDIGTQSHPDIQSYTNKEVHPHR
mgnify:FL=1